MLISAIYEHWRLEKIIFSAESLCPGEQPVHTNLPLFLPENGMGK
jgi:hypothetical protein